MHHISKWKKYRNFASLIKMKRDYMNKIVLTLIASFFLSSLVAQSFNNLTPEQLEMYQKYKSQNNNTTNSNQYEEENVDRSMSENPDQERKNKKISKDNYNVGLKQLEEEEVSDTLNTEAYYDEKGNRINPFKKKKLPIPLEIFGTHIFKTQNLTFEPKLNIPTPPKYILGASDEVIIDISGIYEAHYRLKVTPEGYIRIPAVGMVKVGGLTMENATNGLKSRFSKIYSGVQSGDTHVSVSLGNIRSIRISVVGEAVRPGSYTLPSLATAFNALYACGGPGKMGSMRTIKVIRNGKTVGTIDLYQFLINGSLKEDISLQDEDVVLVEPYKKRITIDGEVKHPAIFEGLEGETLKDLISFAGGFTEKASKTIITAYRNENQSKTVVNVYENQIDGFELQSGDSYLVSPTYNVFKNRVDITGSIFRPGAYALEPDLTIKKLIAKADGVKEDAFLNMAFIIRRKENTIPEIIGFNLGSILKDLSPDIALEKNDSVRINSLTDYREEETVSIWGAVQMPGVYRLKESSTVKDLVFKAKGFTEVAATDSIELIRIIKDPKTLLETNRRTIVMKFPMNKQLDLKIGDGDLRLENGDQVIVRSISGFESIRMVKVDGEVIHPGTYNINSKTERISDLLMRSGGLTKYAYPAGACLIRYEKSSGVESILKKKMVDNAKRQLKESSSNKIDAKLLQESGVNNLKNVKEELTDTKSAEELLDTEGVVGIDLAQIIKNPGSRQDFFLEEGDVLYIPRELQTVRVLGEVLLPTYIGYSKGLTLRDYVSGAGGFSDNAQKNKTFVLYANGSAKSSNSFLGFRKYPPILPGSHIVVPEKPTEIRSKMTTAESVSILGSLATVAALIFSVIQK